MTRRQLTGAKDKNGYDFIIMVKGCKDLVNKLVLEHKGSFEEEWENTISYYDVNGITIQSTLFDSDEKQRYFHIYYSDYKKAKERAKLQKDIQEQKECIEKYIGKEFGADYKCPEYFDLIFHTGTDGKKTLQFVREKHEIISRDIKLCGYFCIITSFQMTAADALEQYKSRDDSEKLFRGDKSYLGERSMRVCKEESTCSKIFIEFVALIIRNKIYTCLKEAMKDMHKRKII